MRMHDDRGGLRKSTLPPEEVDPGAASDTPGIIRDFCSPSMPEPEIEDGPDGRDYVLPGGPVGNLGEFDCVIGRISRGMPASRSASNEFAGGAAAISLPVENLIVDIIVHRAVTLVGPPEVLVQGFPHGGLDSPEAQRTAIQLPCSDRPIELAGRPPAVATPLVPRYSNLIARVFSRMGWTPSDFSGVRLRIAFPPMSSRVVVRWRLPE
jgi:hypothetical protein